MSNKNRNNFQELVAEKQDAKIAVEGTPIEVIPAKDKEAVILENNEAVSDSVLTNPVIKEEVIPVVEELVKAKYEDKLQENKKVIKNKFKVNLITRDGCIAVDTIGNNKRFYGSIYLQKKMGEEFEE